MKRLKNIISIFCLLSLATSALGQNSVLKMLQDPVERGDKLFHDFSYASAIEAYKKGLNSSNVPTDSIKLKIAESFRMLNEPKDAAQWYQQVLEDNENVAASYLLHYADALSTQKKYAEAKIWYEKYNSLTTADSRSEKKLNTLENQANLYRNTAKVTIEKAPFNSEGADFSPTITNEGVIFVSSRKSSAPLQGIFNWDKSSYLDLFVYTNDKVERLSKTINSKFHEGPAVLFDNDNKIIFTRNNSRKGRINTSDEGITKLKLYYAQRDAEGNWSPPSELPFNSDEYSVGHPAISANGDKLYFASDMPGGQGGVDLYVSEWSNNAWQQPVNLGTAINTEGNELFPTLGNDDELYFASNGLGGLGGLDIFLADISKNPYTVNNIGAPINGPLDDFGLVFSSVNEGYFSSNRAGSGNHDDIYTFTTTGPFVVTYMVSGKVYDKHENNPIADGLVYLIDDSGTVIKTTNTDSLGNYSLAIERNHTYVLEASKQEYLKVKKQLVTTEDKNQWTIDLPLTQDYGFDLKGVVTDNSTGEKLDSVAVTLIDNLSNTTVLKTRTLKDGSFDYKIKDYEINDRVSYQIKLEKDSYLAKVLVFNTELQTPGTFDLNTVLNLTIDKLEIGADIGKLIDIKPIYFDVGKYEIRPDAAIELDKIVTIMKENPKIEIELGSHTDSRGSAASNLKLSDKRAKASAAYIISQGIDGQRIVGKGYGEEQLINGCADGVPCSEAEHQLNRRTEFKITSY